MSILDTSKFLIRANLFVHRTYNVTSSLNKQ
uniref:Uncharacterized protein n=1 Tax=Arundo donax TaxID=35708 RepID=A0A0A8XVE7_ARUDO